MSAPTYIVLWRPDRSEGSHREAEHLLAYMLAAAPRTPRGVAWIDAMACAARLCGDLHDPETGLYAGRVSPDGIEDRTDP